MDLLVGSAHPQGGNRMGDNQEECVVDSDCKVFGFNNLYVCDASVFPTAIRSQSATYCYGTCNYYSR